MKRLKELKESVICLKNNFILDLLITLKGDLLSKHRHELMSSYERKHF